MRHFGDTIRAIRRVRDDDPRDIARACGIKLDTLTGYEESETFTGYERTLGKLLRHLEQAQPLSTDERAALAEAVGETRMRRLGIEPTPPGPHSDATAAEIAREIEEIVGPTHAASLLAAVLASVREFIPRPVPPNAGEPATQTDRHKTGERGGPN